MLGLWDLFRTHKFIEVIMNKIETINTMMCVYKKHIKNQCLQNTKKGTDFLRATEKELNKHTLNSLQTELSILRYFTN